MTTHRTIYRGPENGLRGPGTMNAIGYFMQRPMGATVAGPYATRQEAWREADRLDALDAMARGTPSADEIPGERRTQ